MTIRKQDSTQDLETETQSERLGETKDTWLWTGVPLDAFQSIKKEGANR
jgi:hypothetical protein